MMTSLPPYKHGAKRNGLGIYKKVKTLAHFLKRYGYRTTAVISNWPLRKKLIKLHDGFDVYYEVFTKKRYLGIMNAEGEAPAVTQKAVEWLKKNHKNRKRFFLWVQYTDPHALYIQHKEFTFDYKNVKPSLYPPGTRMKKIKGYDSEIAFTDFYIGKFIKELKRLGLYKEALIVFHADHGESFGEHNYFKHGRKLYNSTLHVPLIIKLPSNRLKNTRRQENVSIMDIGRTIFSALNLLPHPQMEGADLFEEEASSLDRKILLETYGGAVHFRRNSKKYHLKIKPIRYGILSGSTKLIYNLKTKSYEVYDLKGDPFETRDIYLQVSPQVKEMKQALLNKINQLTKYIKLNRLYQLEDTSLSKEDLERLKSLGYFE
jgi:arylsulfatase A-like enzyme